MTTAEATSSAPAHSRSQEALRTYERKLAQARRLAHLGFWEYEVDADSCSGSAESDETMGLPPGSTLTLAQFQQVVHPEDRAKHAEAIRGALEGTAEYDVEFRVVRSDGEVRHVHSIDEVTRDESGRPLRVLGAWQDVTDQKRAQESLRESRERLSLALQATGLGPWDWDLRTNEAEFSPEWKRQLGYEPNEISNRYEEWESRLHPDDREWVLARVRDYVGGRDQDYAIEFRLRHRDGSYRWIYTRAAILRDPDGKPTHMLGCHLDISDRKRLEEQFRESQRMQAIGQLAGGVAHDFNNLLTVISMYSDILLPELPHEHPHREMVSEIQKAGQRAAELTRQLLAFSRRTVLKPKVLDLNELVRENETMLRRLIGEDVRLTAVLDTALGPVKVDPGQVSQVIMNLAVNARDAMPTGGKLTIETGTITLVEVSAAMDPDAKPGRYVRLAVTDTGSGMTPEVKARIFEPFFTTKGPGKGTGLGLATVYGMVKQSGGFISVSSEPGRGSAFKLYFPVEETPASTIAPVSVRHDIARGSETILVVEDEDAVRSVIRTVLEQAGYTVLEASRGTEAIRLVGERPVPIHLLMTDVVMPEMGGRELAERLAPLRPAMKVLYLSGYTDDAVVRHGVLQGEVTFLQKPFSMAALSHKVRQVLDEAAA